MALLEEIPEDVTIVAITDDCSVSLVTVAHAIRTTLLASRCHWHDLTRIDYELSVSTQSVVAINIPANSFIVGGLGIAVRVDSLEIETGCALPPFCTAERATTAPISIETGLCLMKVVFLAVDIDLRNPAADKFRARPCGSFGKGVSNSA